MKYIIAVLLSAALIWTVQQNTPVHKSFADKASVPRTTVAKAPTKVAKPPTAPKTSAIESVEVPAETPVQTPPLNAHEELMSQAGIDPQNWAAVNYIVTHESSWNQYAVNASSGSCGLVQELPCGKSGCTLGDGVCQLRWASQYATSRYGSWWAAQAFWSASRWW